jgi:hypothetical protein
MDDPVISAASPNRFGLSICSWMSWITYWNISGFGIILIYSGILGEVRSNFTSVDTKLANSTDCFIGILAGNYAAVRQPSGLQRLIIANAPASLELCFEGFNNLLKNFPEEKQALVRKHETNHTVDDQEYKDLVKTFSEAYICNTKPWPKGLEESFNAVGKNSVVHDTL